MKTLQELQEIRDRMKAGIANRDTKHEGTRVVVGMATCGIAAGARPVMQALIEETSKRNLTDIKIAQTGCIGMCKYEPIVEVFAPGQEKVTYIHMTPDKVSRIVTEHLVNGKPVKDFSLPDEL